MNKFNVRIGFEGEGNVEFFLPILGQIEIWATRDMYVKNAPTEIIEALRKYRDIKITHKLNAEIKGCAKVIDIDTIESRPTTKQAVLRAKKQAEDVAGLKASLIKSNDFMTVDDVDNSVDNIVEEPTVVVPNTITISDEDISIIEEPIADLEDLGEHIATAPSKEKGKKLKDMTVNELKKVIKFSKSEEEIDIVQKYIESK